MYHVVSHRMLHFTSLFTSKIRVSPRYPWCMSGIARFIIFSFKNQSLFTDPKVSLILFIFEKFMHIWFNDLNQHPVFSHQSPYTRKQSFNYKSWDYSRDPRRWFRWPTTTTGDHLYKLQPRLTIPAVGFEPWTDVTFAFSTDHLSRQILGIFIWPDSFFSVIWS